jgi:hypothetical protein
VASVNGTALTNASGFATATITYAKNFAFWATVVLEGRAGVVGNDPPSTTTFILPILAADTAAPLILPPGDISPFGRSAVCTDGV